MGRVVVDVVVDVVVVVVVVVLDGMGWEMGWDGDIDSEDPTNFDIKRKSAYRKKYGNTYK